MYLCQSDLREYKLVVYSRVFVYKLGPNFSSWLPYLDIEINSDTSLAEAVQTLSKLKVLSAPVVDVDAPEDASWIDRYIGIVEFPGIVVWLLHQVCCSFYLLFQTFLFFYQSY